MKITIFGAGCVGLVAAGCLADVGHEVLCVDVDSQRIQQLNAGEVPIYEPGLENLLRQNLSAGRLRFSTDMAQGVAFGSLLFIAVGTPVMNDGRPDLSAVWAVAEAIGRHINNYKLVIGKSTVPVGTAEQVAQRIATAQSLRGTSHTFEVCSNPEFIKEGAAIEDFSRGARIIVGADSELARGLMRQCYAPYNRNRDKLMFMSVRAAELSKYAANAMLATKISFMSEMANLAERLGVDIEQVRQGIGSDPRIGFHFIYPGCGYGGSCFHKDIQALMATAREHDYGTDLLQAVEAINARQKHSLFEKLEKALGGDLAGRTIAVWGLSFKPDTDDIREAPSLELLEALWAVGARVQAFDPQAMNELARRYGERADLQLVPNREAALQGADALVICTEWKAFRTVDFGLLKHALKTALVIDGRNLFDPVAAAEAGLRYVGVGRGESLF